MSLTTIINITIGRPRAKRLFISPVGRSTSVIVSYTAPVNVSAPRVESARSIDQFYSSRAATTVVRVSADIGFVESGYTSEVVIQAVNLNTDIDSFAGYVSQARAVNTKAVTNVALKDNDPPLTNPNYTFNNVSYQGFEVIIEAQAQDAETPQQSLRYGLVVAQTNQDIQDAFDAGADYQNFADIKTGGELTENGNRLFFEAVEEGVDYKVSLIVWDDYKNTQKFNVKSAYVPFLVIDSFVIDQVSLTLDVEEEGNLTYTIVGDGFTDEVTWESLNPAIAESLGNGVFKGVSGGETGARIIKTDAPEFSDTIPVYVADYVMLNDGEESEFDTGPSDFINASYISGATATNVTSPSSPAVFIDAAYSSAANATKAITEQFYLVISHQNIELSEYVLEARANDDISVKEYDNTGVTDAGYQSAAGAIGPNVATTLFVSTIDGLYESPASTNKILCVASVGIFDPIIDGEDNLVAAEYTLTAGENDNAILSQYSASNIVVAEYVSSVTVSKLTATASKLLLDLVVDAAYSSAATIGAVISSEVIIPLFVDSNYNSGAIATAVQPTTTLELLQQIVSAAYNSSASVGNLITDAFVDVTGPLQVGNNTWDILVSNIFYDAFDVTLNTLPEDETTPPGELQFGLLVTPSGSEVNDARNQGPDYINYSQIKTGAQLIADSNVFSFDGAGSLVGGQEYWITAVVWDEFGNSSGYNIKFYTLPVNEFVDASYQSSAVAQNPVAAATLRVI